MKLSTFLQMTRPYFDADKNAAQYTLNVFDWIVGDSSYNPIIGSDESSLYKLFSGKRNLSAMNARKIIESISIDHFKENVPFISEDSLTSLQEELSILGVELVNDDIALTCAVLLESIIKDCATKKRQPRDKSCNTIKKVYDYFSKVMKDCEIKYFIEKVDTCHQFRTNWIMVNCEKFITSMNDNEWRPYTIKGKACTAELLNAIDEFTNALDQYTNYLILNMDKYKNKHGAHYFRPKRIKVREDVTPESDKRFEDNMEEYYENLIRSYSEQEYQEEFNEESQKEIKEEVLDESGFKADRERYREFCEQVDRDRKKLLSLLWDVDRIAANSQ